MSETMEAQKHGIRDKLLASTAAAVLALGVTATKLLSPEESRAGGSPIQRSWEFDTPPSSGLAEDFEACSQSAFGSVRNFLSIRQYAETEDDRTKSAEARGHFSTLSYPALIYSEQDEALYCPGRTHVRTALGIGPEGKKPQRIPNSNINLAFDSSRAFGLLNTQARLVDDYTNLCNRKSAQEPVLSVIKRVDYTEGNNRETKITAEKVGKLTCKGQAVTPKR